MSKELINSAEYEYTCDKCGKATTKPEEQHPIDISFGWSSKHDGDHLSFCSDECFEAYCAQQKPLGDGKGEGGRVEGAAPPVKPSVTATNTHLALETPGGKGHLSDYDSPWGDKPVQAPAREVPLGCNCDTCSNPTGCPVKKLSANLVATEKAREHAEDESASRLVSFNVFKTEIEKTITALLQGRDKRVAELESELDEYKIACSLEVKHELERRAEYIVSLEAVVERLTAALDKHHTVPHGITSKGSCVMCLLPIKPSGDGKECPPECHGLADRGSCPPDCKKDLPPPEASEGKYGTIYGLGVVDLKTKTETPAKKSCKTCFAGPVRKTNDGPDKPPRTCFLCADYSCWMAIGDPRVAPPESEAPTPTCVHCGRAVVSRGTYWVHEGDLTEKCEIFAEPEAKTCSKCRWEDECRNCKTEEPHATCGPEHKHFAVKLEHEHVFMGQTCMFCGVTKAQLTGKKNCDTCEKRLDKPPQITLTRHDSVDYERYFCSMECLVEWTGLIPTYAIPKPTKPPEAKK